MFEASVGTHNNMSMAVGLDASDPGVPLRVVLDLRPALEVELGLLPIRGKVDHKLAHGGSVPHGPRFAKPNGRQSRLDAALNQTYLAREGFDFIDEPADLTRAAAGGFIHHLLSNPQA